MTNTQDISTDNIPKHIAIIMDGNNRFGKAKQLAMGAGHIAGKDALDPIVEHCLAKGVQVLTVFAFSSENWSRPKSEVDLLMQLLTNSIHEQIPRMDKYRIRLRFIGERSQLSPQLQQLLADAEAKTAHFDAMTLVIAISYGGQWDIANAAKALAQQVAKGQLSPEQIDQDTVAGQLALADLPMVDMLIRTGGEYRISNFLLWQAAYAELFFTTTLWPEFTTDELDEMIAAFAKRERRFGRTSEQLQKLHQ
ncbi:Undecaprenyl pyrophosphate synthetase [Moraxella cuniculi DSM 21768]|uniref:Ditrans,polycis-undecaprenyl-diphosphate synthase ((2E,6E)-farnesyl-diphosphate specific) n=1 Tax=Moraxella cuniculi DSM 21768 TaxID=1122245 RepID=A0A1N7DE84_9GAMM|nr:polyprenyl diphosphate synthase [Moraxella cuniculi]OOS08008.1 di-trans,poly-cis-decaprenylcistransferase [Moraxella cuniculi]SIR74169.1 Undecaprenyl pyrophosphate synthetase [Moraxella cuniculi DSM 21768]